MRTVRWSALIGAAGTVLLLVLPGGASAKSVHRATPRQQIATAGHLVTKYHKTTFARGQRRVVLSAVTRASRATRGHRSACTVLTSADALNARLVLPTTWKHSRVPRGTIKRAVGLLGGAERTLLRQAGSRCARPPRVTKRLVAQHGGSGFKPLPPPVESPEQGEGPGIPIGHVRLAKSIGGSSGLGADLHGSARHGAGRQGNAPGSPFAHIASDPLTFFRNSDAGIPPVQASPQEPTAAEGGNVVWYTGNSSVALSTNAGRTFTTFDPATLLPDDGLPLCCDQLVSYSPQRNLFIWIVQYWCGVGSTNPATADCRTAGTSSNRIRVAVATPQALIANASSPGAAWTYWDITPQTFGQPAGAWFDRSDLGVNIWNMQWSVDVLRGNGGVSSVLARIGLDQLANRGTVSISYITDSNQRMTVAQGLGTTTTYFVGTNTLSQQRIWSWDAFSGTLFRHDVNHSSVPNANAAVNGTDNSDWYDRYGIFPGAVESATVSGSTLYTAQGTGRQNCTANCSTNHPTLSSQFNQPSVFISKYNTGSWSNVGERWIWNPTLAFGWPALQTDDAGEVGLVFRSSSNNQNPQPVAGFLTPGEQFVFAEPAGLPHETGDYYSLRPGRTPHSFAMTAQTVESRPGGSDMHWQYIEYGTGPTPYVSPPSAHIVSPANLSSFTQGADVGYSAGVSDPVDGTLPSAAIRWTEDGAYIGSGPTIFHTEGSPGTHVVTVTATNGDGKSASDSITVRVSSPPGPVKVSITSPPDGTAYPGPYNTDPSGYCVDVAFTTSEAGGNGPISYTWTDSRDLGAAQQVSTQANPTLDLCTTAQYNSSSTHDVTVTATDGTNSSTATIRVYIVAPRLG